MTSKEDKKIISTLALINDKNGFAIFSGAVAVGSKGGLGNQDGEPRRGTKTGKHTGNQDGEHVQGTKTGNQDGEQRRGTKTWNKDGEQRR